MSNEKPPLLNQTRLLIYALIENWQKYHFGVWAVVYKNNKKLIGHCGFKFLENTQEIQLGYLLMKSYWGRGLGTEAASAALKYGFEVAEIEKIVAIAKPENVASRRVMEKVGMRYEKNAYYYNNHVVYYGITQEAYQSNEMHLKRLSKKEKSSPLLLVS
jgi:ribosomal-protein-alanine N-acetyltransferase